jgi:hypothetical protein
MVTDLFDRNHNFERICDEFDPIRSDPISFSFSFSLSLSFSFSFSFSLSIQFHFHCQFIFIFIVNPVSCSFANTTASIEVITNNCLIGCESSTFYLT